MFKLPEIQVRQNATLNTETFLGLNRGLSIADGEMADMLNMTSDHYPVLATAKRRQEKVWPQYEDGGAHIFDSEPSGILGTDRLVVCQGEKVYLDGYEVPITLSEDPAMQPKHLVSMGAYVCIWPDKKYINVTNPVDCGSMGTRWRAVHGVPVSAMMCRKDGTNYDMTDITVGPTAPAEPEDKQMWLDTSGDNDVLKQYSAIYKEWVQVATTYIKIQSEDIGKGLKEGDAVFISEAKIASTQAASLLAEPREGESTTYDTTKTLSFSAEEFFLYSEFQTSDNQSTNPSLAERTVSIEVSGIPEGATVTSAVLKFTSTSPKYGKKLLTMNRTSFNYGEATELPVEVSGNGTVNIKFAFRSGNNESVNGTHGGSIKFTGITLDVTYAVTSSGDEGDDGTGGDSGGVTPPADPVDQETVEFLNTTNLIYGCGDDYIIVAGLLRNAVTLASSLLVELRVPDLDYVCEANNRIWGCSYSKVDGTLTNEIRCCALGDFRNWYRFEGTSMDSYVMSVGSDGKFTGAFSLQGVPLMWKEGFLHKISGTQPSNFTLNTIRCRGVQDGSWRSLTAVNEALYYKSVTDVMAYDGAMPYSVSEKLGTERYYDAVAGAYRDKLYISMHDSSARYSTYVLDTTKGLWHKEDEAYIPLMANAGGELIMVVRDGNKCGLYNASKYLDDPDYPWSVTFGIFGFAYETSKYLSRFNIRAQMTKGSVMRMEIMYDSSGEWEMMGEMKSKTLRTFMLPVIPRRCDHCQIRISGTGDVKIYSIARVFEQGGN
jgi:hypothetical protein